MRRKILILLGVLLLIFIVFTVMNRQEKQIDLNTMITPSLSQQNNTTPLITGPEPTSHVPNYLQSTHGATP